MADILHGPPLLGVHKRQKASGFRLKFLLALLAQGGEGKNFITEQRSGQNGCSQCDLQMASRDFPAHAGCLLSGSTHLRGAMLTADS
ncbi:hypothetical protein TSO5_27650 [Azospirillum sp. TSO5]|nr:hypothetical protein TSO5_27650 [Azospirillum sp. TSO5]